LELSFDKSWLALACQHLSYGVVDFICFFFFFFFFVEVRCDELSPYKPRGWGHLPKELVASCSPLHLEPENHLALLCAFLMDAFTR
jgi:hypothetical protein